MIQCLYDCFKHWCKNGSVWIISDTHFEDFDCKYMDPNWITPEEQVKIINKYVYKSDTLIHLGDTGKCDPWMNQIKAGYKVLIMGNHQKGKSKYKPYFDEIYDGPLFISDKILLSHEPISLPFAFNIHGHDHGGHSYIGSDDNGNLHINLAANVCDYSPVNLGNIIKNGVLKDVPSIHRITIDAATGHKFNYCEDCIWYYREFGFGEVVGKCENRDWKIVSPNQNVCEQFVDRRKIEL